MSLTRRRGWSLRTRLGLGVAMVAIAFSTATSIAVSVASWRQSGADLDNTSQDLAYRGVDGVRSGSLGRREFVAEVSNTYEIKRFRRGPDVSRRLMNEAIDALDLSIVNSETFQVGSLDQGRRRWEFAAVDCERTNCVAFIGGAGSIDLRAYLFEQAWIIAAIVAVAAVSAFVLTALIVRRSLRPIEAMRRELAAISGNRLDRRVSAGRARDEVGRLAGTINETLDRLETAAETNQRFVTDAAHELRSPLTGVRMAIELDVNSRSNGLLTSALREVDRASGIVDDLSLLARQGGAPIRFVDVDLDDVAREELRLLPGRYPNLVLSSNLVPARVRGDRAGLSRVLRNLLDNAATHGDSRIEVTMSTSPALAGSLGAPGVVIVHVDDDGAGITPGERERVFERFVRLDPSRTRATGGSGLGLAIVAEVVARHHGTIEITEAPLGGARFTITLPTDTGAAERHRR